MSYPSEMLGGVGGAGGVPASGRTEGAGTVEGFAATARRLGDAARAAGLTVPAFRSPPRIAGVARSIRRYPGGTVVSVRLKGRPLDVVTADMVDGVIVTNRLGGDAALRARSLLADAVVANRRADRAAAEPVRGLPSGEARMVERQTRAA
jgi:hypothetical protein